MLLIQLTGLSGAGKTTVATGVKSLCLKNNITVEVLDGDEYRKTICSDLGFSKEDRCENIRRLGYAAYQYVQDRRVAIIAAINPYEMVRKELKVNYGAKTVWISCSMDELIKRDTKGFYKRAALADGHPNKLYNFSGVSDPFDIPVNPDCIIRTDKEPFNESVSKLYQYVCLNLV